MTPQRLRRIIKEELGGAMAEAVASPHRVALHGGGSMPPGEGARPSAEGGTGPRQPRRRMPRKEAALKLISVMLAEAMEVAREEGAGRDAVDILEEAYEEINNLVHGSGSRDI